MSDDLLIRQALIDSGSVVGELCKWRSIETAPKDGTRIILAEAGAERSFEGYWGGSNWYSCFDSDMALQLRSTHWMPLPIPPEKSS